jgi:hypothetical protein
MDNIGQSKVKASIPSELSTLLKENKTENPVVNLKMSTLESFMQYRGPGTVLQSRTKNLYEFSLTGEGPSF